VVLALLAVPVLWFGGDYLGSGSPFTGGHMARVSRQARAIQEAGSYPPLVVLQRALQMLPPALLLGLPVALVTGLCRRDPLLLALCAGALVWTAEVAAMSAFGYAGIARFLFPAAAAAAVAGGAGLVTLVRLPKTVALRAGLAALLLVAVAASATSSLVGAGRQAAMVEHRADLDQSLGTIMATVGRRGFSAAPHVSAQGLEATALAWRLGVMTEPLRHARVPGVALELRDVPWARFDRRVARHHLLVRPLARDEELSLVAVTRRQ
jgi:hypothetical protein